MVKKIHWFTILSVIITLVSVVLGVTVFWDSFVRLWETLGNLVDSARYYFCEIFQIEHSIEVGVTEKSDVLEWNPVLPETPQTLDVRAGLFKRIFFTKANMGLFGAKLSVGAGNVAKWLSLLLPLALLGVMWIKKMYATPNNHYNVDTKPLKAFKWLSGNTYQPIKGFVKAYVSYVKTTKWVTAWMIIWALNMNLVSICVAFFSFLSVFCGIV